MRNLEHAVANPYQGKAKRVLCVCSAGLLRSPTIAEVLSREPYNFNTRACGSEGEFALIPLTETLLLWADEVVCASFHHAASVKEKLEKIEEEDKPIITLDIPDLYEFRQSDLITLIKERYPHET